MLRVNARLTGNNVVPLSLEPMSLTTHAEPAFDEGATLTSHPPAKRSSTRSRSATRATAAAKCIDTRSNTVYAPGSTTVNELPLLDFAGTSPLLAPNGLTPGTRSGAEVIVH